jgi:YidC/Oxa1 family membrane protein insertase
MFGHLYNTFIFIPLYNGLVGLISIIPWIDAGTAVILFTLIIRLILFPLSRKAVVAQIKMREIQPEIDRLKITHKDDRQAQGAKMMELYKQKGVHPFSSMLLLFIQLPVMYALYAVFIHSGLPVVNNAILYSFIAAPIIKIHFLGLFDVTKSSVILSIGAAVAQYLQLEFSLSQMKKTNKKLAANGGSTTQADMTQNMTKQMKYIFPIIIFIISVRLSGVLSLYWITTNLFTLVQELFIRHRLKKEGERATLKSLES